MKKYANMYMKRITIRKTRRRRRRQNRRTQRRGGKFLTDAINKLEDLKTRIQKTDQRIEKSDSQSNYDGLVGELADKLRKYDIGVPDWYELYSAVLGDEYIHVNTKIQIFKKIKEENEAGAQQIYAKWKKCYAKHSNIHNRTHDEKIRFAQQCVDPPPEDG